MIVVKIELHSARTGKISELGRMLIANEGDSAEPSKHNYAVKVLRRGTKDQKPNLQWLMAPVTRTGEVKDYARSSYNVWRLVSRALRSAFPEEK
jgi:hypothetical protein